MTIRLPRPISHSDASPARNDVSAHSMDRTTVEILSVCDMAELSPGEMRLFQSPEHGPIAIYNVGGEVFATDDFCTHGQASLSQEGLLDGHIVECSWHLGAFDIRTGEPVAPPCQVALKTYPVIIDHGRICIVLGAEMPA
jgi:p-cumate 2,3-dioxygenase ferredoxin subunit